MAPALKQDMALAVQLGSEKKNTKKHMYLTVTN